MILRLKHKIGIRTVESIQLKFASGRLDVELSHIQFESRRRIAIYLFEHLPSWMLFPPAKLCRQAMIHEPNEFLQK